MRKLLPVLAALLLIATPVFAGQAARNTGCGLGTVLWGDKADGNTLSQTMQATTNGTFGNQTFGITSGTLECDQPAKFVQNERLLAFTADNMDLLARDIAAGQGETLDTVAELLEVPVAERPAFATTLQGNFDRIFITGQETAGVVLDRISVLAL
jgi:hypothetical protein